MKQIHSLVGILNFCKKMQEDLIFGDNKTILNPYVCYGYVVSKTDRHNIENIFNLIKFEDFYKKNIMNDRLMFELLGLLSVCVKAHYFMYKEDILESNPYVFFIPDLSNMNILNIGLYYPLYKSKKTIIVSKQNLIKISSTEIGVYKFPVVLSADSNKWVDLKSWKLLEEDGTIMKDVMKEKVNKDINLIKECKDVDSFEYGFIFDVPLELKDKMKDVGLRYAAGIKKYYLPKGYDLDAVKEYYDFLMKELKEI